MTRGKPRRRRPGAAARLRPFWFLIVLIVLLLAAGGYWLATWPGFYPHGIAVSGNHRVPTSTILEAAEVPARQNVWLQNTSAIAKRVAAIPYVDTVAVHREPPASVRITVTEREPFAIVATAQTRLLVDRKLRVLDVTDQSADLPVIFQASIARARPGDFLTSESITTLRDDLMKLDENKIVLTQISFDRYDDIEGTLRDGIRVLFGDQADFQKKIPLVHPILEQVGKNHRPIAIIDLRAATTPVVVYKNAQR